MTQNPMEPESGELSAGQSLADLLAKPAFTLTKAALADMLFERVGLNKREAKDMVETFFEEISALGVRQLPAARQAAASGSQPQDGRGDPHLGASGRHLPRFPEAEGPDRGTSSPGRRAAAERWRHFWPH